MRFLELVEPGNHKFMVSVDHIAGIKPDGKYCTLYLVGWRGHHTVAETYDSLSARLKTFDDVEVALAKVYGDGDDE